MFRPIDNYDKPVLSLKQLMEEIENNKIKEKK